MQRELVPCQKGCWTTILAALKKDGFSQFNPRKEPLITKEHRQERPKFYEKSCDLTPDDGLDVFAFVDEGAMQVRKSGHYYVWR